MSRQTEYTNSRRDNFFLNELFKSVNSKVCMKHLGYYLKAMDGVNA